MWSDSMDYFRASEHIYMRHNIQIDDTTQKSLIFGDFGEYIKTPGDMILVGRPSIINYDAEQGDSLFMRADTFEIFTLNRFVDESDTTAVASATEMARDIIENLDNDVEKSDSLAVEEHDHDHDHDHDQLVDAPLAPIIEEAVAPESPVVEEEPIETETEVEVEESETSETVETKSSTEIETAPTVEEPIVEQQSESVESPAPRPTQSPSSSEAASSTTTTPPPPGKGPGGGPRVGEGVGSGRGSEQNTSREVGRPPLSEMEGEAAPPAPDMFGEGDVADSLAVDSLATDSLRLDSLARAADTLNFWQRTKANYLAARKERAAAKAVEQAARKVVLDSIGRARQVKINEKLDAEKAREARRIAQRKSKVAIKTAHRVRRDVARGKIAPEDTIAIMLELAADSMELINLMMAQDSITVAKARVADSLAAVEAAAALDSLAFDRGREDVDSLAVDSLSADSVKIDSLYRLTKGYRNVKIYRSDFQAVADSMSTSSLDSIIRLYIDPVMWHGDNQVTSDVMDIYTANNQIEKAIFTGGSPIMASEVEKGRYYNQVAGKVITSLFEDGEVYRNDVDGNAQTIYYMQDDDTGDTNGLMIMYSGSATFYIEEQNVVGITYRGEPNYTLYPMNMIPKDQELTLKGFLWQSERQPTRDQVFDRTIRPTVREEMSTVPRPEFPIYEELNALREELMRSRLWIDRTDVVNAQAEEWMESLGYKTGQPREEKE